MALTLTINGVDYTKYIVATLPPTLDDSLNRSKEFSVSLAPLDNAFIPVSEGQRVRWFNANTVYFTGYITQTPVRTLLNSVISGYTLLCESDAWLFDSGPIGQSQDFVGQFAGDILKKLVKLAGGTVNDSSVTQGPFVSAFHLDGSLKFSAVAYQLCQSIGWRWFIQDGTLYFLPQNDASYGNRIDSTDPTFNSVEFNITKSNINIVNDATVFADTEPQQFVEDNFVGNGIETAWDLTKQVFGSLSEEVLFNEALTSSALNTNNWNLRDPSNHISYTKKALKISGGSQTLGSTAIYTRNAFELGGELHFDLGTYTFQGLSVGLLAGIYADDNLTPDKCFAGIWVTGDSTYTGLRYFLNGVMNTTTIVTQLNHSYQFNLYLSADEVYRFHQTFRSATGQFGGDIVPCGGYVTIQVVDSDLSNPQTPSITTTVFDGRVSTIPAFGIMSLLNSSGMFLTCTDGPKVYQDIPVRVRVNGSRSVFSVNQTGNNWRVSVPNLPLIGQSISVLYRNPGTSRARLIDNNSIISNNLLPATITSPPNIRTSIDCENFLLSYLADHNKNIYEGTYITPFINLVNVPMSGRFVSVNYPAIGSEFVSIVRDLKIIFYDVVNELVTLYTAFGFGPLIPNYSVVNQIGNIAGISYTQIPKTLVDISSISISSISGSLININAGRIPKRFYEVRNSDTGWGTGGFLLQSTNQFFSLSRIHRTDVFYLRETDGLNYSRDTIIVAATNYPIVPVTVTATINTVNYLVPIITVTLPVNTLQLQDIFGIEIRASNNITVLYHKNLNDPTFSLIYTADNSIASNSLSYFIYAFDLLNEYSLALNLTASCPIPVTTFSMAVQLSAAGMVFDITPASPPVDLDRYEAITNTTGIGPYGLPIKPTWTGLLTAGAAYFEVPCPGRGGQTAYCWVRAVTTSGVPEAWVYVGSSVVGSLDDVGDGSIYQRNSGQYGQNLIENPGFEVLAAPNSTDLLFAGWKDLGTTPGIDRAITTLPASAGFVFSGTKAFYFTVNPFQSFGPGVGKQTTSVSAGHIPVKPGESYFARFVARVDQNSGGTPAGLNIASGCYLRVTSSLGGVNDYFVGLLSPADLGAAFITRSATIKIPNTMPVDGGLPAYLQLYIYSNVNNPGGTTITLPATLIFDTRFDNVELYRSLNPTSDEILKIGSVPPTFNGGLTATFDDVSITWSWNINVYRTNSSLSIQNIVGSQLLTGLSPNTTYWFYPFVDETTLTVTMVTTGGVGSPSWAHLTHTTIDWVQEQSRSDHAALSNTPLFITTANTGFSGGGGGGGSGGCLIEGSLVKEKNKGIIAAEQVKAGDKLWTENDLWLDVLSTDKKEHDSWIEIEFDCKQKLIVTSSHPFTLRDRSCKRAYELTLMDEITCSTGITHPISIKLLAMIANKVMITCEEPRVFFAASTPEEPWVLTHNFFELT